jgi:uncharacterized DUF497 family protein
MGRTIISENGRFEWDENKDKLNKLNHGFHFSEILEVFDDLFFLEFFDKENSSFEEDRYIGIASFERKIYYYISFTERERIRIISARLAEPPEIKYYDENFRKQIWGLL